VPFAAERGGGAAIAMARGGAAAVTLLASVVLLLLGATWGFIPSGSSCPIRRRAGLWELRGGKGIEVRKGRVGTRFW
jgi:hypothetical protein